MPSIIICNEKGDILYQNFLEDVQQLVQAIREGSPQPGYTLLPSPVRINGMIVFAESDPTPQKEAPKLSRRQCTVLQLLSQGLSPEQIALQLRLSLATVRMHMSCLKKKFDTDSRDQLMAKAGSLGLCDPFAGPSADIQGKNHSGKNSESDI